MQNPTFPLAVCLALALVGCKKDSPDSELTHTVTKPAAHLPAGWKLAEADNGRLAIGVSPGWRALDLTAGDFSKYMDAGADLDPSLKPAFEQARALVRDKRFKMFIFRKPDPGAAFAPNLNIIAMPCPAGVTLDDAVRENIRQIKALHATIDQSVPYDCPGGPKGELVDWHLSVGTQKLHDLVYLFVSGDRFLTLTWSLPEETHASLKPDVERMMKTFQSR